ncbi:MBL fold metallo-hydrolase [Thalassotalea maritima]|uniref:MBL fold metallo-hydrolase n=1 Tax=Thalassotalea maritima TaxID=3242416 RepID=UPI00352951DE
MVAQNKELRRELKRKQRAELEFPDFGEIKEGQPTELVAGVYQLKMPLKMALSHINVYLLADGDGWYIVDTGLPNQESRQYWQHLANTFFNNRPVKGIICTHFHYDHAGLAPFLMELFDAPVWMTMGEYYTLRSLAVEDREKRVQAQTQFLLKQGMPNDMVDKVAKTCRHDPFVSFVPSHFNRLCEQQTFVIGGRKWTVKIGRGHSPEHACLFSAGEQNLLLAGDQVLPDISSNIFVSDTEPFADSLSQWFASLSSLQLLPTDTLVLPSHGKAFINLHARVEQLQQHHQSLLETILQEANKIEQFNAYQAMNWLFPQIKNAVDSMLAQSETLAHLNYLCTNNKIKRVPSNQHVLMYTTRTRAGTF